MKRSIPLTQGWLHFPIGRDAGRYYVRFEIDGQQLAELYLGLVPAEPDFMCGMELKKHAGKTVTLTLEDPDGTAPAGLLDVIQEGEAMSEANPLYKDLYHEALRPQYHFSSRRGWLNDPNGLVFDGEKYHLYYQHNPYGILHGGVNIHWGHATSPDGVRWTEHSDGIRPWVSTCHIASGSCIVDYDGVAGYGKGAIIATFTHLASANFRGSEELPSDGQFLAYSTDGGMSFTLFPECPAIPTENGQSWRDPRIFHDPEGGFGIAVYETTEKGNCVSFYHSSDMHSWVRTARADDLFECPDLFRLTPEEGGEPKWVLYGADSMYRVGEFTRGVFTQEGERFPLDYGLCTYAGQTWTGRDDSDGRMHISWLRDDKLSWTDPTSYPGMGFSQQMTVPCLLKLHKTPDGYRVSRTPIPALDTLHDGEPAKFSIDSCEKVDFDLLPLGDMRLEINCEGPLTVSCGIGSFVYDPSTGEIVFDSGNKKFTLQKKGALSLRILTDVMSCEFFIQDEISASYGQEMAGKPLTLQGSLEGSGLCWAMKSIWN